MSRLSRFGVASAINRNLFCILALSEISPTAGGTAGGTLVTITGTGFSTNTNTDANDSGNRVKIGTEYCDVRDYLSAWDQIVCETRASSDGTKDITVTVDGVHIAKGLKYTYDSTATAVVYTASPHVAADDDYLTVLANTKLAGGAEKSNAVNISLTNTVTKTHSAPMMCEVYDRFKLEDINPEKDTPGKSLEGISIETEEKDEAAEFLPYGVSESADSDRTSIEARLFTAHQRVKCSVNAMGARAAVFLNVSLMTPTGRAEVKKYQFHLNQAYNTEYVASIIDVSPATASVFGGAVLEIVGTGFSTDRVQFCIWNGIISSKFACDLGCNAIHMICAAV